MICFHTNLQISALFHIPELNITINIIVERCQGYTEHKFLDTFRRLETGLEEVYLLNMVSIILIKK